MRHTLYLLLAACALCLACSPTRQLSTETRQPTWEGYEALEIIRVMGNPDQIREDGKGGSILVYESTRDYTSPDYDILDPNASPQERKFANFYLDDEGVCYKVEANRNLPAPADNAVCYTGYAVWLDLLVYLPLLVLGILL